MSAPRWFLVLALPVVVGWALSGCTSQDERGLRPNPSPSQGLTQPTSASPPPAAVEVAHRIPIADGPADMALDPNNELYTSNEGTVAITDIDKGAGQSPHTRISVGQESGALATDSKNGRLYAATETRQGRGAIAVIEIGTVMNSRTGRYPDPKLIDTIVLDHGDQPDELAIDPSTSSLFVLGGDSELRVIDTKSHEVTGTIPVGSRDRDGTWHTALGLDVDTTAGTALVLSTVRCWVIDTTSLQVRSTTFDGGGPVTVDSTTGQGFIPNEGDGTVTVVDTRTCQEINKITLDGRGGGKTLAIDPVAGLAYVTVTGVGPRGPLAVIDTKTLTVVDTITRPEGQTCWHTLTIDPSTGSLYAGCAGSVFVIPRR